MELISIIIPTFNRSQWLRETLESIIHQAFESWECLVIDDGSTDDTANMVATFASQDPRIHYVKRPDHLQKGANSCRNYGFELSKGDFIQWFDDDDIVLEDYFTVRIDQFKENTNLVCCSGFKVTENLEEKTAINLKASDNIYKDYALRQLPILTPSALFRRSYLEHKSLFDTSISRGQEAEFFMRMFYDMDPKTCVIINKPLFLYRQHDKSKSAQSKNYNPKFIADQSVTYIENLKRSLILKDPELIQFFYKLLIHFFFRGLNNGHKSNARYILKALLESIGTHDASLKTKLKLYGYLSLWLNKGSYKLESALVNHQFK